MRGVVTLYTRQLQFLFEDCATVLAHLTTISSEEYCGRRGCHLLISRRKQPKALSRRVDFNHLELEEDIIHIQSGEECMRSDQNTFVVMATFSDAELSPRGSLLYSGELEGEDHVNFPLESIGQSRDGRNHSGPPQKIGQKSATIDQYEQASGRDHSDRIIRESNTDWNRENQGNARYVEVHDAQFCEIAPKLDERGRKLLVPMRELEEGPCVSSIKASSSEKNETLFPLPVNITHDSSVPSPGGQIAIKHGGLLQDVKTFRKAYQKGNMALKTFFDEDIHIISDEYRRWLTDASDLHTHPSRRLSTNNHIDVADRAMHARYFNGMFNMFKSRSQKRTNSVVMELFLQRLNSLRCPFVRLVDKVSPSDADGYLSGCYISRNAADCHWTSPPARRTARNVNQHIYETPSKLSESGSAKKASGFPTSIPDFAGMTPIPHDAESPTLVDSLDSRNDHLRLALKHFGETAMADDRGQQVVESVQDSQDKVHNEPVVFGGEYGHNMPSIFASSDNISCGHNVTHQSLGVQDNASAMVSFYLSELCSHKCFVRKKAARYFYRCLVLLGAGLIEAAQDQSTPYGEILIRSRHIPSADELSNK